MNATVMDSGATCAGTAAVSEGVRRYRRDAGNADNDRCGNGDNASA
jgi:hypothetical protein